MSDLIERIKESVKENAYPVSYVGEHAYPILHEINIHDMGMTVNGFMQVLDKEVAKEPQKKRLTVTVNTDKVLEEALDEFAYKEKTIREWADIITKKQDEEAAKEQEVCKWENVDLGHWKPSCGGVYNVEGVAWFKNCPYCGRKIEVSE